VDFRGVPSLLHASPGVFIMPLFNHLTGVLASFYNAREPGAETLALFASPSDLKSTSDLGTAEV